MTLSVAIAAGPQLCICASVLGGNRVGSKAGSRVMQQATTNIEETDTRFLTNEEPRHRPDQSSSSFRSGPAIIRSSSADLVAAEATERKRGQSAGQFRFDPIVRQTIC